LDTPPPNDVTKPSAGAAPAEPAATPGGAEGASAHAPALVLRGLSVAPGLAAGTIHRKDYDLQTAEVERVARDEVESELNHFHTALVAARAQLVALKGKLEGQVPAHEARILDVHLAYLKDSVFIADVEGLILNEQLRLEAAIAKVISDFDRIFKLVEDPTLRERAVDLRDVGIRVLRHLERDRAKDEDRPGRPTDYILAAKELSIVDMFNVHGEHVLGILTEAGSLASHAAILARSMRIPTVTAVPALLDQVREGDWVILDASEGVALVNPDEVVRAQYQRSERSSAAPSAPAPQKPRTHDGEALDVTGCCGSLPEVGQLPELGLRGVGLYRTELLYLIEKSPPSAEALFQHYASVVSTAGRGPVTFRLLDADSGLGLDYLHAQREPNPSLGRAGVRALLSRELVLRRQLEAILRAGADGDVRIAVPFVCDVGELRRVKECLFEERLELRKRGVPHAARTPIGVVVETPAALLGARDLAREADFLVIALDGLTQHLLAADRDNPELKNYFESLHPIVLRALRTLVEISEELRKPLSAYGVALTKAQSAHFLVGVGLRSFHVDVGSAREFIAQLRQVSIPVARRVANVAASSSCIEDTLTLVDSFKHGSARA
jgi:phosphoenolpyruvate-protein phosphotransferase